MAKGAGMLAPALAMLVVVTTDADLSPAEAAPPCAPPRVTFDRTDSDGCMSTNDTVLLLANAASGQAPDLAEFTDALTAVCASLARQLLADAEGSSHDIAVTVVRAASEKMTPWTWPGASRAPTCSSARSSATTPTGGASWPPRGHPSAAFDPDAVSVSFNGVTVFRSGALRSLVDLSGRGVHVEIDLAAGDAQATVWTNDLTYEYVKENAEYSS